MGKRHADDSLSRRGAKRLHHFVTRSYLRSFANLDQLLAALRDAGEPRSVHVNSVGAEHNFYKARRAESGLSDDVEDALAEFDGAIPQIIRRSTSDEQVTAGANELVN